MAKQQKPSFIEAKQGKTGGILPLGSALVGFRFFGFLPGAISDVAVGRMGSVGERHWGTTGSVIRGRAASPVRGRGARGAAQWRRQVVEKKKLQK